MTCLVPEHLKFWQLVTQFFSTAIVNQKQFWGSIRLAGMFYNSFILFECENILLAKDSGCFAAFIQTAVGRQLISCAKACCKIWSGLDWTGFVKDEFVKHGFVRGGFVKDGFVKHGFVKSGFVKHGFVKGGFVKHGFVKGGFVKGGFVKQGFVKGRFVKHGFVKGGLVKHGVLKGGFLKHEFVPPAPQGIDGDVSFRSLL